MKITLAIRVDEYFFEQLAAAVWTWTTDEWQANTILNL